MFGQPGVGRTTRTMEGAVLSFNFAYYPMNCWQRWIRTLSQPFHVVFDFSDASSDGGCVLWCPGWCPGRMSNSLPQVAMCVYLCIWSLARWPGVLFSCLVVGARPFDLVTGNGWGFVSVFAAGNAINVIFGCKLNVFISVYQLIFIFIYGRPFLATRFLREFDKLQKND